MTNHTHCWHASGEFYASNPPQWALFCCHCEATTHLKQLERPSAVTGPHGDAVYQWDPYKGKPIREFP